MPWVDTVKPSSTRQLFSLCSQFRSYAEIAAVIPATFLPDAEGLSVTHMQHPGVHWDKALHATLVLLTQLSTKVSRGANRATSLRCKQLNDPLTITYCSLSILQRGHTLRDTTFFHMRAKSQMFQNKNSLSLPQADRSCCDTPWASNYESVVSNSL